MSIVLTGSIAYDYLMTFPGRFQDHILPDRLDRLSLSFLVDSMVRRRGGIAANIAYTMALLGERPTVMATVGQDFDEYREFLEETGVDTSGIRVEPDLFTASFFVNTDENNAQIASFYAGAMAKAPELSFADLDSTPELAVISANEPEAMQSYAQECLELRIPYAYDPSQQTVRLDPTMLREGIEGAMAVFVNDYEFELAQDKTGMGVDEMLTHCDFVVITKAEEGAEVHTASGRIDIDAAPPDRIKDPTGVGDAFRAGFLKGYLDDFSLERCGQMGAVAATFCLEHEGPQGHSFDRRSYVSRFREHFDDQGDLDPLT
ncbi:MAG: carbohydrate kinase family protein [Anaerolineales bacterium]|nr:carbohydrate kinase family protein [Anaerolineales bacterium]